MSYNLQNLFQNAKKTQEETSAYSGSGRKYPYKTVFIKPKDPRAKLNVRIVFHPQSNVITFPYFTHKLKTGTLSCGKNNLNNPRCELCEALDIQKAALGNPNTMLEGAQNSRAAMYSVYVSSSGYEWSEQYPEPKQGELILVIGPRTLHTQVNEIVVTNGMDALPGILTDANGYVMSIGRDATGQRVTVAPMLGARYMCGQSDAEYMRFLQSLPPLHDVILFGGLSQEDYAKLHEAATAIMRSLNKPVAPTSFVPPTLEQQAAQAAPMYTPQPQAPVQPTYAQPYVPQQPYVGTPNPTLINGSSTAVPQPVSFQPVQQPQAPVYPAPVQPSVTVPYPGPQGTVVTTPVGSSVTTSMPHIPSATTTLQGPGVAAITPLAPTLSQYISPYCQKKHEPGSAICTACTAEKNCPFDQPVPGAGLVNTDDLPF